MAPRIKSHPLLFAIAVTVGSSLIWGGASFAFAALTFSGTNISGTGAVVIDGSSTVTIGDASNTVSMPGILAVGTTITAQNLPVDVLQAPYDASPTSTDNAAAINAALATGRIVSIQFPGTYSFSSPLLIPNGGGIVCGSQAVILSYTGATTKALISSGAGGSSYTISNCTITKSGLQGLIGIETNGMWKGTINNNVLSNWQTAIDMDGTTHGTYFNTIDHNIISGSVYAIRLHTSDSDGANRNTVTNNQLGGTYSISCESVCDGNIFYGNDMEDYIGSTTVGINMGGVTNTIIANWMEGTPSAGQTITGLLLLSGAQYNTISGNSYGIASNGGAGVDFSDTASGQTNTVSEPSISTFYVPAGSTITGSITYTGHPTSNGWLLGSTNCSFQSYYSSDNLLCPTGNGIAWSSTTTWSGTPDVGIRRLSTNTLWITNGASGFGRIALDNTTPSSSSQACVAQSMWADANYIYVCTASGVIKRAALASF